MCGIAGLVTRSSASHFRPAVEKMAAALAHRGPDSRGVESLGPCLLGNARLAIVDLSERGKQPLSSQDGAAWITYNGECYNAAELRQMLVARGHQFRSTTDTEVVLHLYQEFGEDFVEKLRGMFAFAIWDTRARKLVLARDRFGIKPLYYADLPEGLLFASEIKCLLASDLLPRQLNPGGLRAFLQLGHMPPPWTAIEQVKPLEPGHVAVWQEGAWTSRAYWDLGSHLNGHAAAPGQELPRDLGDRLVEAMRGHLVSDVPILLFLSGGIDSACLGALARHAGADNLTAMTVAFEEEEFDESELSARTALALEIPHRIITMRSRKVSAELDHAVWAMDQPTVDGLNSYWISRLAAEAGFKVALSGQGGDEFFGGYESLAWFERFNRVARFTGSLPKRPFHQILDRPALPFRWRKLSYLFGCDDPFVASQLTIKVHFLNRDLQQLLSPALAATNHNSEAEHHLVQWAAGVKGLDLKEAIAFMDIHTHLEPRLLRDMDAMSMAHSLEVRPIFLDHVLAEFLLSVPPSIRIRNKRLLLDATRRFLPAGLAQDLTQRRKRTFTFPFARWLQRDLRETMEQTFSASRLRDVGVLDAAAVAEVWQHYKRSPAAVGWSRIWTLFVLQRWCEMMRVSP